MSKDDVVSSRHRIKIGLLSVAITLVVLVLLFGARDFRSILSKMGIVGQAVKVTLPIEHSMESLQPGSMAPDIKLAGNDNQSIHLRSLAGERVALVFANVDCPHCQDVIRELKRLCPTVRIKILALVEHANGGSREDAACFHLVDTTEESFRAYGVASVPTIYLLDAEQRVISAKSDFGDSDSSNLAAELTRFLQQ